MICESEIIFTDVGCVAARAGPARSLVDDLHSAIKLPTVWITLDGRKFAATSTHTHTSVAPAAYFVLEDHAATSAEAITTFIRSLVRGVVFD